jgi:predicted RNA binding protein YcfA (HicA-like mRNA interferase family)
VIKPGDRIHCERLVTKQRTFTGVIERQEDGYYVGWKAGGFQVMLRKAARLSFADGTTTVVPVHSDENTGAGLPHAILRDVDASVDE